MIKNLLFISSVFLSFFHRIKTLPIAEDNIWSTFLDIRQFHVDVLDDVSVTLAQGNNPFQDDEVTLEIVKQISGKKSSVAIKRSRILADKSTTVWYGLNTHRGFGDIRYEKSTIEKVPEEFPDFAMFQNYEEKIALVAFGNETHWIWEGFIGNSLIQHISGNLYVLLDVTFPLPVKFTDMTKKINSIVNHVPVDLNTKRMQVIPEILVALDWKSVENKTARDVIKEVIVYYNAVDMLFSQFTSPRIQLNIAGIVIPLDSQSSPYFEKMNCKVDEETYYSNECFSFSPVLDILIRHFRKYIDVFFPKDYDIIMGMTSLPLCDVNGVCEYGTSFQSGTCEHVDEDHYAPITGAVRHPNFRGNYWLAAREIGHMLGSEYIAKWADVCYGGVMSEIDDYQDLHQWRLNWSTCAVHDISIHIRERENYTKCMWNLPDIFEEPELSSTTIEITAETTMEAYTVPDESTSSIMTSVAASNDTTPSLVSTDARDESTTTEIISTITSNDTTPLLISTDARDESTTTEIISTTTSNETTTPIIYSDTSNDKKNTTTHNIIPVDCTYTTSAAKTTTVEPTTLLEENISTAKKPQTLKGILLNDPVSVIVIKRNVDGGNDLIIKRPTTLKTIVSGMVHSIYDFINKTIRRDVNH